MSKMAGPSSANRKNNVKQGEGEEEEFSEKIRNRNGRIEYLPKGKVYSNDDNPWEPEENPDYPDLISESEENRKKEDAKRNRKRKVGAAEEKKPAFNKKHVEEYNKPRGFDRGLEPESILGATDSSGELMFLMKWKEADEADLVPARQANVLCPHIVIQFYEQKIEWDAK